MRDLVLNVIALLALPIVTFVSGAWVMSRVSNREYVVRRLRQYAAPEDQRPLNQRLGYDVDAVCRHWGALDIAALHSEQQFLKLDLFFPFVYGVAMAASLMMAWAMLGRPFALGWLFVPLAVTVFSDWTENLVQLRQLARFVDKGAPGLQVWWIRISSAATILKLLSFSSTFLLITALATLLAVRTALTR